MTTTYSIAFGQSGAVRVQVAVVDRVGHVDGLASYLPRRWATRQYDTLFAADSCDLLVLGGASADLVAAARLMHPEAAIVAVIDAQAPVEPLVAILSAGADACIRAGAAAILAGHLLASHRRRMGAKHSQRLTAA
jgi:hypothetical protein